MQVLRALCRFWAGRRDRFAFSLFPIRLEIKHHEHADHNEKRANPFHSGFRNSKRFLDFARNDRRSMGPGFPAFPDRLGVVIEIDSLHAFSD